MKTMEQLLAEIGLLRATLAEHGIPAPEGSNAPSWLVSAQADAVTVAAELATAKAEVESLKGQLAEAAKLIASTPTRAEVGIIVAKAMAEGIAKAGIRKLGVTAEEIETSVMNPNPADLVGRYNSLQTDGERAAFMKRHGQQLRQAAASAL